MEENYWTSYQKKRKFVLQEKAVIEGGGEGERKYGLG